MLHAVLLLIFSSGVHGSERVRDQLLRQVAHRLAHPQLLVAQNEMPGLAGFAHAVSHSELHGSCRLLPQSTLLAAAVILVRCILLLGAGWVLRRTLLHDPCTSMLVLAVVGGAHQSRDLMRLVLRLLVAVTVALLLRVGRSRRRVCKPGCCCLINVPSDL